ncbi:hypothetical protein RFI_17045 [Reticulomyxa filosa]|uniref:RRM domain-containing protein n=1 Tax=Reticulomyxa filosa TaxID=46433 RepID=X6N347_RETFI|nr:hypothetical protein RFI_17045 [Reticulomyxa filosa]|eukprot:ETO20174.1 hypothetical protein RFI_17045 [Reticulomyxa filosa]
MSRADFEDLDVEIDDHSGKRKKGDGNVARKGRGHERSEDPFHYTKSGAFESVPHDKEDQDVQRCMQLLFFLFVCLFKTKIHMKAVEGYVLFVRGIHEEAKDDDVYEVFGEYGHIKQLHLNLDRLTGFVKGYALIEYATFKEAKSTKDNLDGAKILGREITVDWAFKKPPH